MARNIYSFIKIEKRQTKRGIYASAFGIASLICMAVLTIASFVKAGNLPAFVGGIGYLSFLSAVFGLWLSVQLRKDNEAYGTMVHGAFYINLASVMIHGLIFWQVVCLLSCRADIVSVGRLGFSAGIRMIIDEKGEHSEERGK